jgi:hypothetical protein
LGAFWGGGLKTIFIFDFKFNLFSMNKKFYIDWDGRLYPLKKWIRENHQLINGYIYEQKDITHRIEDKLEQLGWNSIYYDVNHWQILTLSDEIGDQYKVNNPKITSNLKSINIQESKNLSSNLNNNNLANKLKQDYNRRSRSNLNGFGSFDDFLRWYSELNKVCYYCGLSEENSRFIVLNGLLKSKRFPENGILKRGKARGYYLEVDRKNPENNYSSDNCVLACYFCNNDKSDVFNSKEYIDFYQDRKNYLEELVKKYRKNE